MKHSTIVGYLFVFAVLAQNYLSQVSSLSDAQVNAMSLHAWVRVILHFLLASTIALSAYLTPSPSQSPAPTAQDTKQ